MHPLIILAGFITFIVVLAIITGLQERKRTQTMQAFAESLKFSFSASDDIGLLSTMERFHLFSLGRSHRAFNIMRGTANDINVTIMDYRYTTGSGKHSHTWNQTVFTFQSPLLHLPGFTLCPENLFHKIGSAFGYQDIDFPEHPGFSSNFLLQGEDESAIRAFFTNEILSQFEQSKGLNAEGRRDMFLFYRANNRVSPDKLMAFMQEGFHLFRLMKMPT